MNKVLILGSGALKIGQAGEFDYSGSQALKALKEEGIKSVLINPNIATIQTSSSLADKIYFLPVTSYFVEEVIKKEAPDGIMLSFGGQTALNCGLELEKTGVLKKYVVKVLGTPVRTIEITEDRELFAKSLQKIGIKIAKGGFATTVKQALKIAKDIGYPLLIRSGFSLGGLGSAIVQNKKELAKALEFALKNAPQITVEEYLKHWKEVEYEVVRDEDGNKITVCNMENLDPLGVHTGESIVVAPSQTLNNYQYHFLRTLSLKVIEHLRVVGECNIQFALDPFSNDYRVIEVNARLSRSSALASKATGYPLAYIAAKLGLGYKLPELKNSVTKSTSAFFEPALDYIVIKIPRWDLKKFKNDSFQASLIGEVEDKIGSSMQSVGEVMAIGRSFPEALQKALRMLEIGKDGLLNEPEDLSFGNGKTGQIKLHGQIVKKDLLPSTQRVFTIAEQLASGVTVEEIYKETGIDPWFLHQIRTTVEFEMSLPPLRGPAAISPQILLKAKKKGFSDRLIGKHFKLNEGEVRDLRRKWNILPKVKHIDTLAAEYPAKTNYLYLTYHGTESEVTSSAYHGEESEDARGPAASQPHPMSSLSLRALDGAPHSPSPLAKAIVLGSGPYRIGSSVEFDWCSVTAAVTFREKGLETIIINCNPETVSTDFDIADKLYFEELTFERVLDIYEIEENASLALSFGGQVPNNLALKCFKAGLKILGTSPTSIDQAEDRNKFSVLLDKLKIDQPAWQELKSLKDAEEFAKKIGYPVLIRPSYVLSGNAMNIVYSQADLENYLNEATSVSKEHPVVVSKFIDNAKEIEIDGVAQEGELIIYAISEHIENAGVHSGDATIVLPPQRLYLETMRQIKVATNKICQALNINGPFNIQFLAKDNEIKVIELNLRASRSFPFVSKVTGYNFVEMASKIMLGERIKGDFKTINIDYVGVKAPQFSFNRIKGADPKLRVEMASTGEVACFGEDLSEAYLKSLLSTGLKLPHKGIFLAIGGDNYKIDFFESAQKLAILGLKLFATEHTHLFLNKIGVKNTLVYKIKDNKHPSTLDLIQAGKVDLTINISVPGDTKSGKDGFLIRRACIDLGIPLFTNLQAAEAFCHALTTKKLSDLEIKSWDEYVHIGKF